MVGWTQCLLEMILSGEGGVRWVAADYSGSSSIRGRRRLPRLRPSPGGPMMKSSRREFLQTAGALGAAFLLGERRSVAGGTGPAPLKQFGYGDVELLEGPLRRQFDANHAFYAAL